MGRGWGIGGNEQVLPGAPMYLGPARVGRAGVAVLVRLTPSELIAPFRDLVSAVDIGLL